MALFGLWKCLTHPLAPWLRVREGVCATAHPRRRSLQQRRAVVGCVVEFPKLRGVWDGGACDAAGYALRWILLGVMARRGGKPCTLSPHDF